jgi:hypothetical protein
MARGFRIQRLGKSGRGEGHGRQHGSGTHEHVEFTPR